MHKFVSHEKDIKFEELQALQCRSWFECYESSASSALKQEKSLKPQV